MTAALIPLVAEQTIEADCDDRMAEVAERLDIVVNTRLLAGRLAAGPAQLPKVAVHPLPPCATSTLRLEVPRCL